MIISDSQYISGITPKVIETQLGVFLNGQYHLKDSLVPVPFKSAFIYGSNMQLMMNKRMQLTVNGAATQYPDANGMPIIQDSERPDVYYIWTNAWTNTGGNNTDSIVKIKETEEKDIEVMGTFTTPAGYTFIQFLGQSPTTLYFVLQNGASMYVWSVDKTSMTYTVLYSLSIVASYPTSVKIFENSSYIYFAFYHSNSMYISQIIKANTGTAAYENINITRRNIDATNYIGTVGADDVVDFGNGVFGFYFIDINGGTAPLRLIKINTNLDKASMVTVEEVSITWNGQRSSFPFDASIDHIANRMSTFVITRTINSVEKKFVNIFDRYTQGNTAFISKQGLYTFEMIDYNNLVLTDYSAIDLSRNLIGCLFSNDYSFLIMGVVGEFFVMRFNDTLKKYEKTQVTIPSCYAVALDQQERLWYQKLNYEVEVVSLNDAATVNIEFEKQYYEYEGVDINTYILFSATNFTDNPATGSFELTISGSAVFTETNSKTLSFILPEIQPLQIPIKIIGGNQISIYPKFINAI